MGKGEGLDRAGAAPEALALRTEIVADHGPVIFYRSGGCCDGSSPVRCAVGDLLIGDHDVQLGAIGGMAFNVPAGKFEGWWHTDLIVDVV